MSEHLRLPLTIRPGGSFATVAEDSVDEIVQNVAVALRTREGERLATPDFGTPDPTFVGFDTAAALAVVGRFEPRADLALVAQAMDALGQQSTDLNVTRRETT